MKTAIVVVGILFLTFAALYAVGALLPVAHSATRTADLPARPDTVWNAVSAFTAPSDDHDDLRYEIVESTPPQRLVRRIANTDLPFGGRWTFILEPTAAGTRLTITEDGEVYAPFYRFMSRYVFGHTRTMDAYLKALSAKLAA